MMLTPRADIQKLDTLKELLSSPQKIVVTMHVKPDADALGSSLGLAHYLKSCGHEVSVVAPSGYPDFLHWLPGNDEVHVFDKDNEHNIQYTTALFKGADVVFYLDFSALNRVDHMQACLEQVEGTKVLIDHHRGKQDFADYELWDIEASSTAELVYDFIHMIGGEVELTSATCIYSGILTDTGSFKYPASSSRVHRIVAHLIDLGIDNAGIHRAIYDTFSEDKLKFWGYALNDKLTVLKEYHTAYFSITAEEFERFNYETGFTEGLVNYALAIKGVKLAAIFMERDGMVRMSLRSVGDISVSDLASKYFNGGGHKNAAGGRDELPVENTVKKFLSILPTLKEELV